MLVILLDMLVIWFLLNVLTSENWDEQKLTLLLMAVCISFFGVLAVRQLAPLWGLWSLGAYFAVGVIVFWAVASVPLRNAAIAMAIFTVYKVGFELLFA